jgi:hypothetical protein
MGAFSKNFVMSSFGEMNDSSVLLARNRQASLWKMRRGRRAEEGKFKIRREGST